MNLYNENNYLNVLGQINLDDLHIQQTFEYYQKCYQVNHRAQAFFTKLCHVADEYRDSLLIGLCDRTIGKNIPKCRSPEGAAIRGSLQRCGLVKPSGHELFRGCIVLPSYDDNFNVTSAVGYRMGRLRTGDKSIVYWHKPEPKSFVDVGMSFAKGQSSDTVRNKRGGLKKFFLWCLARNITHIDQVNLDLMDEYAAYLNTYRKALDNEPLSPAQKRNLLTYVKIFIKYMYIKGLLSNNRLADIELPNKGHQIPKALYSVEEIERILEQPLLFGIKGLRDRAILETFFTTGIRRGELVKLNIDDIDFNAGMIRIHGKGNKERLVPISQRGCEWLAFYIGKVRSRFASMSSGKALFLANNGKRYVPGKLSDMASQYVKLAGFDRTGACHLFRHNTASTMLDNGADLRHIQEMLGHASILTTQLYTHVSRKKLTQVYNDTHPSARGRSGLF